MTSITGIRTTIREEDFFVFDAKSSQDFSCIIEIQDTSETVTDKRFQFDTHLVSFEVLSPGNTRFANGNDTAYRKTSKSQLWTPKKKKKNLPIIVIEESVYLPAELTLVGRGKNLKEDEKPFYKRTYT